MQIAIDEGIKVSVSTLGENSRQVDGLVLSCSGRRLNLAADLPAPPGTAIRIEWTGYLIMGEVTSADPGTLSIHNRHALRAEDINYIHQRWF